MQWSIREHYVRDMKKREFRTKVSKVFECWWRGAGAFDGLPSGFLVSTQFGVYACCIRIHASRTAADSQTLLRSRAQQTPRDSQNRRGCKFYWDYSYYTCLSQPFALCERHSKLSLSQPFDMSRFNFVVMVLVR